MSEATTERTVAPQQLLALINDANQKKTKMQSISGELGARIKEAVENGHLNRKAFGLVAQLDRQDEDKRNDNVRAIRLYLDICEEQLWSDGHVGDIADLAEARAAKEAEAEQAESLKNAAKIGDATPEQLEKAKRRPGRPKKADTAAQAEDGNGQDVQANGSDPDPFVDDAESDKPSMIRKEQREALPGADAAGSYDIRH